jgi:protein phosphatase
LAVAIVIDPPKDGEEVEIPLSSNRKELTGPFDIVGDLHGCADELEELLRRLGWVSGRHPEGRTAIFLGDLVDRGPRVLDTLQIVRSMVAAGTALCVAGNHDVKLMRWLAGKQVQVTHGLAQSIAEIEPMARDERARIGEFLDGLPSHYVLDGGRLVVAHAGLREEMHGRSSNGVRRFCLYGETTGETDEFGLPMRYNWAAEYRGQAIVVYGHTPVPEPEWLNNTVNIDTGAVFGGKLTALRYPEREFVSVPAAREYAKPIRPIRAG